MNNNCQHLSPKTGKWEPCVGPENCDYRKQGLDVPHAYSQSEREAIDAERAGVGDGLQDLKGMLTPRRSLVLLKR